MDIDQLKKQNYIPNIISTVFSLMMFGLLALPHSQYDILSEMTFLNNGDSFSLFTVLPAIFTIFVILFSCVVFLSSLLSLFMTRFYNYHFVSKIILICCVVSVALELLYFFFGLKGTFDDGSKVIGAGNIVTVCLNGLFLFSYLFSFVKYISHPFHEISLLAEESLQKEESFRKEEEKKKVTFQEKDEKDSEKKILDLLSNGKITSEEALKLLHALNDKKS